MSYFNRGRGRSSHAPRPVRFSRGVQINPSLYVNAAIEPAAEKPYINQNQFSDFGLSDQLMANIQQRNYTTPTPIQDQAIPALMGGRDVVGIANTGTGKTAAFLLPLIHKIDADPTQGALILAPTRELAVQILEEFRALAAGTRLSVALCIGGANINSQISRLRENPHFVIGTPGRLKDLIQRNAFKTDLFTNIVLDEVDRMLDIGFRRDIDFLINHLPAPRQSAFFSATINRDTEQIMQRFLDNPVRITVKSRETGLNIHQDIVKVTVGQNKFDVLHGLLDQQEFEKVIVFGRTKHGINKLEEQLSKRGLLVTSIHGNKSQNARQRALTDFKRGKVKALLATDVAARGIDIDGVTHVINFDEPQTYDDYVHRIGRTGRAGKLGKALTFVC